jgi:hypothetical protein
MSDSEQPPLKPAETTDVHTPTSRERLRMELAADVEAFLRKGGAIQAVIQEARADIPPASTVGYERDLT